MPAPAAAGQVSRRIPRTGALACCLITSVWLGGCGPLATVAASVISGFGGGGGPTAPAGGAMGGAPSTAQNGTPRDRSIKDVLDHVDNQDIEDSCLDKLPPDASAPVTQCVMRPSCLPGMSHPITMRVCPAMETQTASKDDAPRQASAVAQVQRSNAATAWRWEDTP